MVARWRTAQDLERRRPRHAVWELTLSCNLKCRHCGSRAGAPRSDELNTAEALSLVDALADAGVREVTLIGGEAYLRRDWLQIVRAIRAREMYCGIQTGGRALTYDKLAAAKEAGLDGLGVSIDGPPAVHDDIRGMAGAFGHAVAALRNARALDLKISVNSQINALTAPVLDDLYDIFIAEGVTHWQPMLTVPMGNAVENTRLMLQPHELLEVIPRLAAMCERLAAQGVVATASNTIGYFGPFEKLFRGFAHTERHWMGCEAAATGIGIEADGTIKGCPSLETRKFKMGAVRDTPFEEIWEGGTAVRARKLDASQGKRNFCDGCYYRDTCIAGCTWHADSVTGDGRDNPFCHYRALSLSAQGLRERVEKVEEAAPIPFAAGRFAVILEDEHGTPASAEAWAAVVEVQTVKRAGSAGGDMVLCGGCDQFFYAGHTACPHCAAPLTADARDDQLSTLRAYRAMDLLRDKLGELGIPLAHDADAEAV
jgi:radical SAM protein with 4Fe4S-binding SPASM domain